MSVGHFATKVDRSDEAHFPAKRSQEETEARLPRSDANARGTGDSKSPACQGTDEAVGLSRRRMVMRPRTLPSRRDFERVLRAGARARRDGITVSAMAARRGSERVGMVARGHSAVERNRIKRRLRAALLRCHTHGLDAVVMADATAATLPFERLVAALQDALDGARRRIT
jgi:ribonuclease P protein component